ncbi:MAG: class I SAM-dependent methyltransferase [Anaeromyxobacteraceae bacterium]
MARCVLHLGSRPEGDAAHIGAHVLTLDPSDVATWNHLLPKVIGGTLEPSGSEESRIAPDQLGAFRFFAGTTLAARSDPRAPEWLGAAAAADGSELRASAYLAQLVRRNGHLTAPSCAFDDPRAYVHFAGLPAMQACRAEFVSFAVDSLPPEVGSLRVLDVGCGDGGVMLQLLPALLEAGRWDEVAAVTLLDPSPEMLSRAKGRVASAFPDARVEGRVGRLEDVASLLVGPYDLVVGSLSLHHMPAEVKRRTLATLAPAFDHLLLLELDADHDAPEVGSPALAASVHQTYGWMLAQILGPDTPDAVARESADRFVAPELVSLLTQPRGARSEYHMRRERWHDLLSEALGPDHRPLGVRTALATAHTDLFAMHFGRLG